LLASAFYQLVLELAVAATWETNSNLLETPQVTSAQSTHHPGSGLVGKMTSQDLALSPVLTGVAGLGAQWVPELW
jgi:hypothetical protein